MPMAVAFAVAYTPLEKVPPPSKAVIELLVPNLLERLRHLFPSLPVAQARAVRPFSVRGRAPRICELLQRRAL